MTTIVTNVKERLRSRSRHRYSTRGKSIDDTRPPLPSVAINGWEHANGYDLPKSLRQEALAEPAPEDDITSHSPTEDKKLPEMSQMPQMQGLGIDPSLLAQSLGNAPTFPTLPQSQEPPSNQAVPDRHSSLRNKNRPYSSEKVSRGHRRAISQPMPPKYIDKKAVPDRTTSSRPKMRHVPIASTSPQLGQYEAEAAARENSTASDDSNSHLAGVVQGNGNLKFSPRKDSLEHAEVGGRVAGHRTGRSVDLAPYDPSPLMPRFRDKEHEMLAIAGTRQAMAIPDDVRIPDDFALESYQRTNVSTEWRPAVIQEAVHHQKTEIIQEHITRDIHIHHHYEHFQPIKVVEILPARHWFLDLETGKKIEIPEPTGWMMPENIRPTKPDASTLVRKTRHYLVNDDHPNGIEEPASETHEETQDQGRVGVSSTTAAPAA